MYSGSCWQDRRDGPSVGGDLVELFTAAELFNPGMLHLSQQSWKVVFIRVYSAVLAKSLLVLVLARATVSLDNK